MVEFLSIYWQGVQARLHPIQAHEEYSVPVNLRHIIKTDGEKTENQRQRIKRQS